MFSKEFNIDNRPYKLFTLSNDSYYRGISPAAEKNLIQLVRSTLPTDATAVDIGANIGAVTLILSDHLSCGDKVISFEPGVNNFAALKKNIDYNQLHNVIPFNIAISSTTSMVNFYENSAYGFITETGTGETLSMRFDHFAHLHPQQRIDFIKIDVEGHEWDVIIGASDVIKKFSPLIYMELNIWCILGFTNHHPKYFLNYLFDNFEYVGAINHDSSNLELSITRYNVNQINNIIYRNLKSDGLVTNLLLSNNKAYRNLFHE